MKALCWKGVGDIRYETVPDPKIEDGRDAIVQVTSCAICGSDLHLYDGFMPGMKHGDIMGHEFMGEVVEVGKNNKKLKVGDRVVVPFTHLRRVRAVQARQFFGLREDEPKQDPRRQGFRSNHGRPVWIHAPDGRLSWRRGRVCARALCRCRPYQGAQEPF